MKKSDLLTESILSSLMDMGIESFKSTPEQFKKVKTELERRLKQSFPDSKLKIKASSTGLKVDFHVDGLTERASWDKYFMNVAYEVSTRATCPRRAVGSVIVRNKNILSTGYNGSPSGAPHCIDIGCLMENNHCIRVNHSEINAICQAAKNGVAIDGAVIYTTTIPCLPCFRAIVNSGINKIYYSDDYPTQATQLAQELGFEIIKVQ